MATNNAWNTPDLTTDGQTLIGNTGSRPSSANLTAGANVTIIPGPGTNTISSSGGSGDFVKISSSTASSSASIDFNNLNSTYFLYMIQIYNVAPATDAVSMILRTSTNNGSSFDSGASDYAWNLFAGSPQTAEADGTANGIVLFGDPGSSEELGNGANEKVSGYVYIFNPSASKYTFILCQGFYKKEDGNFIAHNTGGYRLNTTAVNAVSLLMDSGNIASGDFTLYGVVNT